MHPLCSASLSHAWSKLPPFPYLLSVKWSISTVPLATGEKSGSPFLNSIPSIPYLSSICPHVNPSGFVKGFLGISSLFGNHFEFPLSPSQCPPFPSIGQPFTSSSSFAIGLSISFSSVNLSIDCASFESSDLSMPSFSIPLKSPKENIEFLLYLSISD